jgi:HEAT repeat protein
MPFRRLNFLILAIALLALCVPIHAGAYIDEPDEVASIAKRFGEPRHIEILQGALWTAGHDYKDFKHTSDIQRSFIAYLEAIQSYLQGDRKPLELLGGIKSYKATLISWLNDSDPSVRAFSATIIGITGDEAMAGPLVELMKRPGNAEDERLYDKGSAAIALGLLGAQGYKTDLAEVLKSKNAYSRNGAITALGMLGAKEYEKQIVSLMLQTNSLMDDHPAAVIYLLDTNTAHNYKKELAVVMRRKYIDKTAEAAMWALVKVNATEQAPAIAQLLDDRFRRADAAKALALLDARQYKGRVIELLSDSSGLVRAAAAIAVGTFQDKNDAIHVAKLFSDKDEYVRDYAATAIFMLKADRYYARALPYIDDRQKEGTHVLNFAFSPIVGDKVRALTEELNKTINAVLESRPER